MPLMPGPVCPESAGPYYPWKERRAWRHRRRWLPSARAPGAGPGPSLEPAHPEGEAARRQAGSDAAAGAVAGPVGRRPHQPSPDHHSFPVGVFFSEVPRRILHELHHTSSFPACFPSTPRAVGSIFDNRCTCQIPAMRMHGACMMRQTHTAMWAALAGCHTQFHVPRLICPHPYSHHASSRLVQHCRRSP